MALIADCDVGNANVKIYDDDVTHEITEVIYVVTSGQAKIKITDGASVWTDSSETNQTVSVPSGYSSATSVINVSG